jgi:hypothetical protein
MADQGKDVTRFFTGGQMMNPIPWVKVDFNAEMSGELDAEAAGLNVSRRAVIKTLVREGLDRRYPRRESPGEKSARVRGSIRPRRAATK